MAPLSSETNKNFATNHLSKFKDWRIRLQNGATLTGISYIPSSSLNAKGGPLIVGLHGGTCCAYNYDVTPEYTASIYCDLLSVPFVAVIKIIFDRIDELKPWGKLLGDTIPTRPLGRNFLRPKAKAAA